MKYYLLVVAVVCMCSFSLNAQTTMHEKVIKERKEFNDRTLVQQFEKGLIPNADERVEKRKKNEEKRQLLLATLDTMQIKEALKLKLQHDVVHNPFSPRLQKFLQKHGIRKKH